MPKFPVRILSRAAVCAVVAGTLGAAAQPPEPAPLVAPPTPLRIHEILERPLTWPDSVVVNTAFSGGSAEVEVGDSLTVHGIDRQGVAVELPGTGELTLVPHDWTDVVGRASALAAALPDDLRKLTLAELVTRADLYPPTVRLTTTVEFEDKVREAGRDIGPYKMIRSGRDYLLAAVDPDLVSAGKITQRQSYALDSTDFLAQLRARVTGEQGDREPRMWTELRGRLVNADGETVTEPEQRPKYYAIYASAGWCGWCAKFNPTLVKLYGELREEHPEVEFIYLSNDRSEEEMRKHMREAGMMWPAVKFEERLRVPFTLGLATGSTPQVVVVAADGRIIHDGVPAGVNGANAALNALRQELRRKDH